MRNIFEGILSHEINVWAYSYKLKVFVYLVIGIEINVNGISKFDLNFERALTIDNVNANITRYRLKISLKPYFMSFKANGYENETFT